MQKEATEIVRKLQDNNFEAYFAGGCVRDILLGLDPQDIDIATNAKADQVQELFPENVPIGKQFGVILVKGQKHQYEVATFREEGPYLDKRRPSSVKFSSAQNDAKRRDFTINGLFFDPVNQKIIDYVGGQEDIKKKTIRFIGDAKERIEEDNLRLIRAIRFKVTLNFQYSADTFDILTQNAPLITNVSSERLREEINKILLSKRRHIGMTELSQSRIIDYIIPEINKLKGVPQPIEYHHEGDVFTHTYLAIKSLPTDAPLHLVWAVLLHDIGKPSTLIKEMIVSFFMITPKFRPKWQRLL
jgi:poly(A) polymerase